MTRIPRALQIVLWPLSVVYGCVVRTKRALYEHEWLKAKRLDGAVISVGNISTGGTGKTPMVMWLAEKFLAEGKSVAILTRGYKGSNGTSDEVEVMKKRLGERVRFGVGADRYAEGRRLEEEEKVDIFLLDDGFQHLRLARDVDIVLMDATRDWTEEKLLPAGFLREPMSALECADVVLATRVSDIDRLKKIGDLQVFPAITTATGSRPLRGSDTDEITKLREKGPLFAFCGIGNPKAFFWDLEVRHLPVIGSRAFADHHKYSVADVERLESEAKNMGAKGLITTEKDEANLSGLEFGMPVWVSVIQLGILDDDVMLEKIRGMLREKHGAVA
ncbi:MAG TPA: tetraacyldisaccharide 4'-kinase [Candidatus Acidoferrum sp.]